MLKKRAVQTIRFFLSALSHIIPKKKGYLVFQPIHNTKHLSGNIKAMIIYAKHHYKKGKIALIAFENNVQQEAEKENIPVVKNKLKGYWHIFFRAEFIIIDASKAGYAKSNLDIIQLWHGTGFKNVGLLNENNSAPETLRLHYGQYKFVIATSETDKKRKKDSFECRVEITGSPRNDLFFKGMDFVNKLLRKYNLQHFEKIISYTPTFRDFETTAPFTDAFWDKLNDYMVRSNQVFIVKKHPWDKYLRVPKGYSNIMDLSETVADVQELLIITDFLISDYSGIISDYVITGKPVLLYMYDYKQYLETCRTSYFDLNKILPRPFAYNETEVLVKIKDMSWVKSPEYKDSYQEFTNMFHTYLDGNSSQRVMKEIEKLL